jgi:type VI secretion system protein ImpL
MLSFLPSILAVVFANSPATAQNDQEMCASDNTIAVCSRLIQSKVSSVCEQTVNGRYPFTRASRGDVPLDGFARLFGVDGVMDQFFKQYLAPNVDTSTPQEWTWRPGVAAYSSTTLRAFQTAAWIRETFVKDGRQPSFTIAVSASPIPPGITAHFESGGTTVVHPNSPGALPGPPTIISWPGPLQRAAITATNSQGPSPSILAVEGVWSLLRLLEAGGARARGATVTSNFITAGNQLSYQITVDPKNNPLDFATLRQFRCPSTM